MKKLLAILLAAACAFSLAACAAAPDTPAAEEQPDCIGDPTTQQLAAPLEAAMAQYPNEAKYTASNGNFDSEKYDEDWDAWWESYQEKTADMTDPAAMTHWFTTSIPALMQDTGKENRVCSPLNIYMALSMLAAVTDGQTRQQILDALGAESLELLQKQTAQLWTENSWDDGLVTSTLANSIWLRDGYNYNSETLQKLGEEFYASAFSGEMGTDAYNNMLRDWSTEHTGNLLTEQASGLELAPATVLALASKTDFLFLDETFDGLDPIMRNLVKKVLYADVAERGATAVITSHSLRELDEGVRRGIEMTLEQLAQKGQPACADSLAARDWLIQTRKEP